MTKKTARTFVPILIFSAIVCLWIVRNLPSADGVTNDAKSNPDLFISKLDIEKVKAQNLPILLNFAADHCIHCIEMKPVLDRVNREMKDKAMILYADVWEYPEIVEGFPVQVLPTQFFINADGTPYVPSEEIRNSIPYFSFYNQRENNEHIFTVHYGGLSQDEIERILKDMGVSS